MTLPSDIESYLTKDEKVIKTGKSREWEIYITNKRVIFRKGGIFEKEIVEASYRHISSIEYKKYNPLGFVIGGIFFVIFGFAFVIWSMLESMRVSSLFYELVGSDYFTIPVIIGVFAILFGIIMIILGLYLGQTPYFIIHVVGRKPLTVSGKLEEIIRIIREYREKVQL